MRIDCENKNRIFMYKNKCTIKYKVIKTEIEKKKD